ncbi:PREDICTED: DNA-directed RNA polymerase III subunit RPC9 isoform X3 [Gekko japonicus]|uniref:DNA-directed RNA polymerase III subunit RPC9 n=1 Tax=Gekko japonicus TaxID=146911 RepID=A0ABM1K5Z5_GEKJA|nr:PREDICTED: DNA-directed RNA polymerase III subunit RPC9 isoform X3 [Gekko japonicus]
MDYLQRKDGNAALLSNYEVYKLLTDLKQQRWETGKSKHSSGQQNLNTIMYETLKYISKTPCKYQSPEIVTDFLLAVKNHKLTKPCDPRTDPCRGQKEPERNSGELPFRPQSGRVFHTTSQSGKATASQPQACDCR